jgi:hypothetical protein
MKHLIGFLLAFLLMIGCDNVKDENSFQKKNIVEKENKNLAGNLILDRDSLNDGDIFVTTGPTGNLEKKEGKVFLIADSVETWPVVVRDSILMVRNPGDNLLYPITNDGKNTLITQTKSGKVFNDGRMIMLTDDGQIMDVKLIDKRLVVITLNNTMMLLTKKI